MAAPRVLLLATTTGYQVRSFGESAERIGIDLVLGTDRCKGLDDPWRDAAIPVRFHKLPSSLELVARAAASLPFAGVLAVGDRPVLLAALVAEALGLPGHPPAAAAASRNKLQSRLAFERAGLPVPRFTALGPGADGSRADVTLPCVVKPLVLSGSRGVIRADTPEALVAAVARVRRLLDAKDVRALRDPDVDTVLVEDYIPGDEYAVECVMEHGRVRVLALFDKPDALVGPYFEETIYVTPSRASAERQRAIGHAVASAAEALGLRHGPLHVEVRVDDAERVWVLEVGARPIGGLCARALRFERDGVVIPFEELLLRHALGETTDGWSREADASGVMMVPIPRRGVYRRVDGVNEARAVPHVADIRITAKPDQQLVPLPEGASYLGFIFARAATPALVEQALRDAHQRLAFVIDAALDVL